MNFTKSRILVPFAADGSCFNPTLRCPKSGKYIVGEKGKELEFDDFEAAREHIMMMYIPRWRRPNEAGDWEVVSTTIWKVLPEEYETA